ncbi:hypothetical protein RUND412_009892 [Rhizina undulata]
MQLLSRIIALAALLNVLLAVVVANPVAVPAPFYTISLGIITPGNPHGNSKRESRGNNQPSSYERCKSNLQNNCAATWCSAYLHLLPHIKTVVVTKTEAFETCKYTTHYNTVTKTTGTNTFTSVATEVDTTTDTVTTDMVTLTSTTTETRYKPSIEKRSIAEKCGGINIPNYLRSYEAQIISCACSVLATPTTITITSTSWAKTTITKTETVQKNILTDVAASTSTTVTTTVVDIIPVTTTNSPPLHPPSQLIPAPPSRLQRVLSRPEWLVQT